MQFDHRPSTGSLVQAVDILRQDRTEPTGGLQRGQGGVAGVRLCRPRRMVAPALPGPTPDLRVVDVGLDVEQRRSVGVAGPGRSGPEVGMPESVLMPAPVSTTTRSLSPQTNQSLGHGSSIPAVFLKASRHRLTNLDVTSTATIPSPRSQQLLRPRGPARCSRRRTATAAG